LSAVKTLLLLRNAKVDNTDDLPPFLVRFAPVEIANLNAFAGAEQTRSGWYLRYLITFLVRNAAYAID
jgi:hypothetical protein